MSCRNSIRLPKWIKNQEAMFEAFPGDKKQKTNLKLRLFKDVLRGKGYRSGLELNYSILSRE